MANFGFSLQNPGAPQLNYANSSVTDQPKVTGIVSMRPAYAHIEFTLEKESKILADAGAMLWLKPSKDEKMAVNTWCHGGCFNSCCRSSCAGEPCCQNTFEGPGVVGFGYNLPGDILPFVVTPASPWIISKGMFVCGDSTVTVGAKFKGCALCLDCFCCAGQCLGEGPFLTHVTTEASAAVFYAGGYGEIQTIEIPHGSTLLINSGLFFASHADIEIGAAMPGDCKALCCSGEGMCLKIEATDSALRVFTQNRDQSTFEKMLTPMPEGGQGGAGDGGDAAGGAA